MRIAFLGMNGPLSLAALGAAARDHQIVAIARPASAGAAPGLRGRLGQAARALLMRRADSLDGIARQAGIRVTELGSRSDPALAAQLLQCRPDVLCVATYPWLLAPEILSLARLGSLNVHAALLPRHRGLLPLFWVYHADDRRTGVTVHWMDERADGGDIVHQSSFALPRGEPVDTLNRRNAEAAGPALVCALAAIADGSAARTIQDETKATAAPFVRAGTPMVAFDSWGAERVWHFLAGLYPRFVEPLRDAAGNAVPYRGVHGYALETHRRAPGTLERVPGGIALFCRDGLVHLET